MAKIGKIRMRAG